MRLFDVDAPEIGQPHGEQSRNYLARLVAGRTVLIENRGHDQFGRILGVVTLQDGTVVNTDLIASGMAWRYRHSESRQYKRLEREARSSRRGLWKDRAPEPPWVWREKHPRAD